MKSIPYRLAVVCALAHLIAPPSGNAGTETTADGQRFESLLRRVKSDAATVTEPEWLELLTLGRTLYRHAAASAAMRTGLDGRRDVPIRLLRESGDAAFLAGDLRVASSRYQRYLENAGNDAQAAATAVRQAHILMDYLDMTDDACRFLDTIGARFDASPGLQRFDAALLEHAKHARNAPALARRLARIMRRRLPLVQEHVLCWRYLDDLIAEISSAEPAHWPAADDARRIAGLIRGNPTKAGSLRFRAEYLAFRALDGQDPAADAEAFSRVEAAAHAYLEATPTADTVRDILMVFAGGINRFLTAEWERMADRKRAWFRQAFGKIPDPDRKSLMDWTWANMHRHVATPGEWAQLGERHPEAFRGSPAAANLSFLTSANHPEVFIRQAAFLEGVPSSSAAAIRALATAGTNDPGTAARHLVEKESWMLRTNETWSVLNQVILPAFREYHRKAPPMPDAVMPGRMQAPLETALYTRTVWALLDPDAGRQLLLTAWNAAQEEPEPGNRMIALLRRLDWVPYDDAQRKWIFTPAKEAFQRWADAVRKRHAAAQQAHTANPTPEGAAALQALQTETDLIPAIAEAFRQSLNPAGNPSAATAPDPLSAGLVRVLSAARSGQRDAFLAAAREVYKHVRAYDQTRIPFGRGIIEFLVAHRPGLDLTEWHAEVLADQVRRVTDPGAPNLAAHWTLNAITTPRQWPWTLRGIPEKDREAAGVFNDALAAVLLEQIEAGRFWTEAFEWFRHTRQGAGWRDAGRNTGVLARMIERKVFPDPGTVVYMLSLMNNEFQPLKPRFPFDETGPWEDGFIEEIRKTRLVNMTFFSFCPDRTRKVANAIAECFSGFETLPLGYDGQPALYDWASFWNAQNRIWSADAGVRETALKRMAETFGRTRADAMTDGVHLFNLRPEPKTPEERAEWFTALNRHLDAVHVLPWPCQPVQMTPLLSFGPPESYSETEIRTLERMLDDGNLPRRWPEGQGFEPFGVILLKALIANGRAGDAFARIPAVWMIARDTRSPHMQRDLALLSGALAQNGHPELGAALAGAGLDMLGETLQAEYRAMLQAVRSRFLADTGAETIPVDRADPRWPVHAAQQAYRRGRRSEAWDLYRPSPELAIRELKQLDPLFSIWLTQRHTADGEYREAERLGRALMQWVFEVPDAFAPDIRAALMLAVADIAFAQQDYTRARAQFERISLTPEFNETDGQREASLRMAEVDLQTRQYDRAVQHLERLLARSDPRLQAPIYYQLARIRFEQEDAEAARDALDQVFSVEPNHAPSRILEGLLNLRQRKWIEATRVRVGLASDRHMLTPGYPLRIGIEDRSLSVARTAVAIEIRAWTGAGDEEGFALLPFGDSKIRFEGKIDTTLGAPASGDRILQVHGGDTVYFDFTDRFKEANGITNSIPGSMKVVSDAELVISAGPLPGHRKQPGPGNASAPGGDSDAHALHTEPSRDRIHPGRPIRVRVEDPDRSTGPERNTIHVRAEASSGDHINRIPLLEIAPHSGIFEGIVPTAPATPTAFASDSREGSDPNFAITEAGYPPWVARGTVRGPNRFSVDLNHRIALGRLTIHADLPGYRLRRFLLQTSTTGKGFENLAAWPDALPEWDGAPRLEVARLAPETPVPVSADAIHAYLETGYRAQGMPGLTMGYKDGMRMQWDQTVGGHAKALGLTETGLGSRYVGRVSVNLFMPYRQTRVFRLDHRPPAGPDDPVYALSINGKAYRIHNRDGESVDIPVRLDGGIHRLDVGFSARRGAPPDWRLLGDHPDPPYRVPCPPEWFAINHPDRADGRFTPATVTADTANETFGVQFPKGAQARIIRLLLLDYEGTAPAIRRMALTDAEGQTILPVPHDPLRLRENETLEILPGDTISVVYEDPTPITPSRQTQSKRMRATFQDGTIEAFLIDATVDSTGNRQARYVRMARYIPGDPIGVFIRDADLDVSDEPDSAVFRVERPGGESLTLEATESGPHTGIFVGRVFPVSHPPERPSELQVHGPEDLILVYRDETNTSPGVPEDRKTLIWPVVPDAPQLNIYTAHSHPLDDTDPADPAEHPVPGARPEAIPRNRALVMTHPRAARTESRHDPIALHRTPLRFEYRYSPLARTPESEAIAYVQTRTGRAAHGLGPEDPFNPEAPGTVRLRAFPSNPAITPPPQGYRHATVVGDPQAGDPLEDGRFSFMLPLQLGPTPSESLVDTSPREASGDLALTVRGDDEILIGIPWPDGDNGATSRWITARVPLARDVWFDVMDRRYHAPVDHAFIGETLYLRVVDPSADRTEARDPLKITVRTDSGEIRDLILTETLDTSGIFKGIAQLGLKADSGHHPEASGSRLPVRYGDTVHLAFQPDSGDALTRTVHVYPGADGRIRVFTKRYPDSETAVQTQLTLAEAYIEQARHVRALDQTDQTHAMITRGRQLLEEAIQNHPGTLYQAQAEFLLAELSLELADETAGENARAFRMDAIRRYSDLIADVPESPYAPRSQFKKALAYEQMGETDAALDEYVKLSYRYPDHELVAETIARIGQSFLQKGRAANTEAGSLEDPHEKETRLRQARVWFRTAGEVLERLEERFPGHALAGRTTLLAGQSYIRADERTEAIRVLERLISARQAEPEQIAEAMYWTADSLVHLNRLRDAYRGFTRLTWDYPESPWARYARGRLTEPQMVIIENEEGRSR